MTYFNTSFAGASSVSICMDLSKIAPDQKNILQNGKKTIIFCDRKRGFLYV